MTEKKKINKDERDGRDRDLSRHSKILNFQNNLMRVLMIFS